MLLGRQAKLGHEAPIPEVLRTRRVHERRCLMKMLIAKHSDEILGLTTLRFEASELMVAVRTRRSPGCHR
jgi:pyruvate/2-oxoglutarate dehydrogenase complex dihydrolipoamide dehydrogenase (E3) component